MSRSKLHIAVLTAFALATPLLLAGPADAASRGERHADRGGIEIYIGDRGDRRRRGHREHRRGYYDIVPERRIVRKVRRLGGERIRSLYLDGGVYRVKAVDYRGYRMRYKFDAYTGKLISARPARRGGRHRGGYYGRHGGFWIQAW